MDLCSPAVLKAFCARAGVRPSRAAGQNFLINRTTRDRIIAAVDPQPDDTIVEIGAGFGVLTMVLAERGARVMAMERDRRIVPVLRERMGAYRNAEVVEGDILRVLRYIERAGDAEGGSPTARRFEHGGGPQRQDPRADGFGLQDGFKLVANLPYGITSDFLRLLFDRVADGSLPPPERVVLLLQREVVDRMIGSPGARGFLTALVQLQCSARRIARVPPSHFWPEPKVESAVVTLDDWRPPEAIAAFLQNVRRDNFLRLVRHAFAGRRQQIGTRLSSMRRGDRNRVLAACRAAGVEPTRRPETLAIAEWIAIARCLGEGS